MPSIGATVVPRQRWQTRLRWAPTHTSPINVVDCGLRSGFASKSRRSRHQKMRFFKEDNHIEDAVARVRKRHRMCGGAKCAFVACLLPHFDIPKLKASSFLFSYVCQHTWISLIGSRGKRFIRSLLEPSFHPDAQPVEPEVAVHGTAARDSLVRSE